MARADAAPGGVGAGRCLPVPISPRVLPWSRGRSCVLCRDAVLARRDDDHVRRPCAAAGSRRRRSAGRLSVSVSRVFCCPRRQVRSCFWTNRTAPGLARLGCERAWTAVRLGRFSVGASGLQPGDLAADRAAGERGRGLRTFGASCAVGIRGRAGDSRPGSAANCAALDSRCVHPSARRVLGTLGKVANGGLGVDVGGRAGARGRSAGQRRAGPEMGSASRRRHLRALSRRCRGRRWRAVRRSFSGPSRRRRTSSSATLPGAAPSAGSRIRDRRPSSWEAIRSSRSRSRDRGRNRRLASTTPPFW